MKLKRKKGKAFTKKKTFPFRGVEYKSGLEKKMAVLLHEAGIPFKYESQTFELMPRFRYTKSSYERQVNGKGMFKDRGHAVVRAITYTPDFIGDGFIIETKGHPNDEFRNKWKLFKHMIQTSKEDIILFKPQSHAECEKVISIIQSRLRR